jgi:hypothetical protein
MMVDNFTKWECIPLLSQKAEIAARSAEFLQDQPLTTFSPDIAIR